MEGKIEKLGHLFSDTTVCGKCALYSMDCSPGQDGGALVNKEDGKVVGIYSRSEVYDG